MLSIKAMLINYGKFIRSGSSMLVGQVCLSKVMLIERFYCNGVVAGPAKHPRLAYLSQHRDNSLYDQGNAGFL
jgi:hypothetical protein